jgi:hypothetical protein
MLVRTLAKDAEGGAALKLPVAIMVSAEPNPQLLHWLSAPQPSSGTVPSSSQQSWSVEVSWVA